MSESFERECVFEWTIRNLSYCWFETGKPLESQQFFDEESQLFLVQPSLWSIIVYPRGIVDDDRVSVRLRRQAMLRGIVEASFKFTFLDKNDSLLIAGAVTKQDFTKECDSDVKQFVRHDQLFGTVCKNFIPDGILKVQCTLWIKNKTPSVEKLYLCEETIFEINRRDFFWKIKGFSTANARSNGCQVMNGDEKVMTFRFCLRLSGEIFIRIKSWNTILKSISFDVSAIDLEKRRVTFGSHKILTNDCEKEIFLLSREKLMEDKSRYLPNDVLSLICEFTYSCGTILNVRASDDFGPIYPDDSKEDLETLSVPSEIEPQRAEALVADLKSMYEDAVLSDTELRTSTKSFPAHKTILSARSSVFTKMFSSDMRETNSGHVDIADLEDDTVHRMLRYVYTDFFGDLQFESASKLYSAADKYAIFSLKKKCASFLTVNVSPATVCDLLALADMHRDDDFKIAVQDYILTHDKEVFASTEWKDLMATNLQLAADVMYRKVCPR